MTNNVNAAVLIEDEPIHEIYAGLVGERDATRRIAAVASRGPAREDTGREGQMDEAVAFGRGRGRGRRRPRPNPDANHYEREANRIPADECNAEKSSSQFITFYRRSCQTQQSSQVDRMNQNKDHGRDSVTGGSTSQPRSKSTKRAGNSAPPTKKSRTTKSERRRMAKLARERQERKERRIRMMLRSDFTEEDELLYRRLT